MPQNLKAPNFYDDLAEALHDLVKFAPNGHTARRIAALASLAYSTLMNGLSRTESNAGCQLRIESLESIIAAAGGERFVAEYFAVKAGGLYVSLPEMIGEPSEARRVAMETMGELGALCRSFEHAQDQHGPGGREVTDDELEMFQAQANKLMSTAKAMIVACEGVLKSRRED